MWPGVLGLRFPGLEGALAPESTAESAQILLEIPIMAGLITDEVGERLFTGHQAHSISISSLPGFMTLEANEEIACLMRFAN